MNARRNVPRGFTIIELLIVMVVITILAAITIVAYNGITSQAKESSLRTDLTNGAKKLHLVKVDSGSFPLSDPGLLASEGTTLVYSGGGSEFCLQATNAIKTVHITQDGSIQEGGCPLQPIAMQTVTKAGCPAERTVVFDARDNHSYFIQKLADGQCWMLTNLAYAGGTSNGGANIYSDTISTTTLTNGTSDSSMTYTEAKYYVHSGANPTIYPDTPSTSTGGSATNRQYGYHYNWCAAMGAPISTDPNPSSACTTMGTPAPDTSRSVCPAGWRLPTGEPATGEFAALAASIGATDSPAGSAILRSTLLVQYAGAWAGGFSNQGSSGYYWSSTQYANHNNRYLYALDGRVYPAYGLNNINFGHSVRCLAV